MKASVCGMVVFVTVPVWAVVTNITSGGGLYGTIQAAVDAANNGDTLLVSTGVYRERVFIAQKSVNLLGGYFADFVTRTSVAAATSITAGGAPGARVTVVSNCTVVLERLWIRNGTNLFGGGMVVEVGGVVTAQQCAIGQNMAWFGGGVAVGAGTAVMVNAVIHDNVASGGGGLLAGGGGSLIVLQGGSNVRGNYAGYGGGIFVNGGEVVVMGGADIFGNVADQQGGGMYLVNGARGLVSGGGTVIGTSSPNRATNSVAEGGGVYVRDASLVVSGAQMYANYATTAGGGIYVTNGSVVLDGARIGYVNTLTNTAAWGGGICAIHSSVRAVNGTRISYCSAHYGGGVLIWNTTGVFHDVEVKENVGLIGGGGIYGVYTSVLEFVGCVIQSNLGASFGGGVVLQGVTEAVVMSNTLIRGNSAGGMCGGLYAVQCKEVQIAGGGIEGNSAADMGGGYFDVCQAPRLAGVGIVSNQATRYGGIVFGLNPWFEVVDCDLRDNRATNGMAGALYAFLSRGQVRTERHAAVMSGNEGNHGGACVVDSGSHVEFMAPEFALVIGSNRSAGVGGALWVRSYGTVTVAGVVQFVGNTSAWGGAIFATNHAVVTVVPTNGVGPVFVGNSAGLRGGAVYLMATSQLTAVNCVFRGNRAGAHGGAIANAASYARIVPNFAEAGGGIPTLFEGNRALYGGAIYGDSAPLTWVDSALIVSNVGTLEGGGIDMDNKAVGEVVNCVIIGNDANNGGGIWVSGSSSARLRHCTVVGNSYGVGSAGGPLVLSNCIVRGNTFGQVTSGHTVRYSNIEGGYPGTGNINADPLFVNAAGLDFSLKYGSPCVDAGAPAGVTWDCVGKVRPMGLGYDMGAYEQDPAPVQVVHPVVLDFGDVVIGDSSNLAVSVVNAGNSALNGAVNFVPVPTFSVSPGTYTITPQAATNVVVTFSPAIEYRWTQTVQFASNGGNTNVTLIGTGIPEPAIGMVISLILLFEAIRLTWRKGKRGLC